MPRLKRRNQAKEKYWRRLLREWRGSGLTGRDFCGVHGLSEPSFYAWRREIGRRDQERTAAPARQPQAVKAAEKAAKPAFLKVTVAGAAP